MAARRVIEASRSALEARRAEILRDLDLTYAELAERAEAHRLIGDEWAAWEEITELEYLLG